MRGVEGVRDREPLGPAARRPQQFRDLEGRLLVAGDHHGRGSVDGRDGEPGRPALQIRKNLLLGGLDGDHGAAGAGGLHQPAARGDQFRGVVQGQHPGRVGGGQLTDRVPGQQTGGDPVVLQEPEQCHFEGEQRGLRVRRLVEQGGLAAALRGEDHLAQRQVQMGVERAERGVQCLGEHRMARVQLPAHAGPLGALTGEEERGAARAPGAAGDDAGRVGAPDQRVQTGQVAGPVLGEDDGALLEGGTSGGERPADRRRFRRPVIVRVRPQPLGLGPQRVGVTGRQQPGRGHGGSLGGRRRGGRRRRVRGLLEHDVRVGAADAEGGHGGPPGPAGVGPGPFPGEQLQRARVPVHAR